MAPGVNINTTYPGGRYTRVSGTSLAAPFVTGAIALLMSIFTNASVAHVMRSIMGDSFPGYRRTVIPPLLNSALAWDLLKNIVK